MPSTNGPWAYIWDGLLSQGFLPLRFGGLFLAGLIYLFLFIYFFLGGGAGGAYLEFYGT